MEPMEPGAGKVPQVPEVPDAMGSVGVLCLDCVNFDQEASLCAMRNRPVDPMEERRCPDFAVPF